MGRVEVVRIVGARRALILAALAALAAVAAIGPAAASAAQCPVNPGNATEWLGGSGNFGEDVHWSNGTPSGACDVTIAQGSPTITMTAGANAKSFTLGGPGSSPQLVISAASPNTNLDAQPAGITIKPGTSVTLTCPAPPTGCLGGAAGGAGLVAGPSPLKNEGTIKVDSNSGTGAAVNGLIDNTGSMIFEKDTSLGGQITNHGSISVGNGATVFNYGSACGGTGPFVKNDGGGTIATTGTGVLSVRNYEQGNGSNSGNPVHVPCGSIKYTGNGASTIRATGGFNLSGEMQDNQSLTISAESDNTNAVLQSNFTNKGSISLTCPPAPGECNGGSSGGVGFNAAGNTFANAGTVTIESESGSGSGFSGGLTNTGTIQFKQNGYLHGVIVNKGAIKIAEGKTASSGGNCGDGSDRVKNETGGSIKGIGAGTGTLSVVNYEQGNGTTTDTPVVIPCGSLAYTGSGASTVQVNAPSTAMTGNIAAGQTLRLVGNGGVAANGFTNTGSILYDQTSGNPEVNVKGGILVNKGTIAVTGASANNALVNGSIEQTAGSASVDIPAGTRLNVNNALLLNAGRLTGAGTLGGALGNSGGTVAPGPGPAALTATGNFTQGPGGTLEAEIEGTGSGQFDRLSVGGNVTLGGTLALQLSAGFVGSSALGDSVGLLTYGGSRSGEFGTVTTSATLACPKQLTVAYDDSGKKAGATVSSSGASCGAVDPPKPPAATPDTTLTKKPKATIKTKKAKVKVEFAFSSDVAGASFECKLDKGAYAACSSPKSYKVKPGKHTFSVRAAGPGGTDASPATAKFKVVKKKSKPKK